MSGTEGSWEKGRYNYKVRKRGDERVRQGKRETKTKIESGTETTRARSRAPEGEGRGGRRSGEGRALCRASIGSSPVGPWLVSDDDSPIYGVLWVTGNCKMPGE